jgi:hypothetical protein
MVAHLIPEFCMKINEKLGLSLKDEHHFISLLFTLWASLSASDFALRATTGQDDPTGRASRKTTQQVGRAGGFHLLRY